MHTVSTIHIAGDILTVLFSKVCVTVRETLANLLHLSIRNCSHDVGYLLLQVSARVAEGAEGGAVHIAWEQDSVRHIQVAVHIAWEQDSVHHI